MPILTVDEARLYAHDYESTDAEMAEYVALAEEYMKNAVGSYSDDDSEAKHLARLLICDFDNNRSTTAKDANSRELLAASLILHLQLKAVSNLDTTTATTGGTGSA